MHVEIGQVCPEPSQAICCHVLSHGHCHAHIVPDGQSLALLIPHGQGHTHLNEAVGVVRYIYSVLQPHTAEIFEDPASVGSKILLDAFHENLVFLVQFHHLKSAM